QPGDIAPPPHEQTAPHVAPDMVATVVATATATVRPTHLAAATVVAAAPSGLSAHGHVGRAPAHQSLIRQLK
ncbi:hypothetical protein ABTE60_20185, partial [Acinetobacter baumannii]